MQLVCCHLSLHKPRDNKLMCKDVNYVLSGLLERINRQVEILIVLSSVESHRCVS